MVVRLLPFLLRYFLIAVVTGLVSRGPAHGDGLETVGSTTRENTGKSSGFEGVKVDSIEIVNRNVFDSTEARFSRFPFSLANRLHIKTRKQVIGREILLRIGQPYSAELAEETARNLRSRCALYDAWTEVERLPDGRLLVRVVTIDLWSLIIGVRIQRDGNRTDYNAGIEDRNLLGLNQYLSFYYYVQDKEENYFRSAFTDSRFFGFPVQLSMDYSNNPLSELRRVGLSHPYYDLQQKYTWSLLTQGMGTRVDVFRNNEFNVGTKVAESFVSGNETILGAGCRWGSYHTKITLDGEYKYHSVGVTDTTRFTEAAGADSASIDWPRDSTYHQVRLSAGLQRVYYAKVRRIDGFGLTEDFTLGQTLTLGLARAVRGSHYLYDQVEVLAQATVLRNNNLLAVSYLRNLWLDRGTSLRQASTFTVRYYNSRISFLTLACRVSYRTDVRYNGELPLNLGGDSGIRGYDKFYHAGDRVLVTNIETRLFPGLDILSTRIGGVVFADGGRSFEPGDRFSVKNMTISVGLGLRVSFERYTKSDVIRVDLARTGPQHMTGGKSQWQVSFGTRQYF